MLRVIISKRYQRFGEFDMDLALLELGSPVDYLAHPNVRPICFPNSFMPEGDEVSVNSF